MGALNSEEILQNKRRQSLFNLRWPFSISLVSNKLYQTHCFFFISFKENLVRKCACQRERGRGGERGRERGKEIERGGE